MNKERLVWLDSLKGIAIFFVILGHILLGFIENNAFPKVLNILIYINDWIYTWHMPLFMAISGYSFHIAYIKNGVLSKEKVRMQVCNFSVIYLIFQTSLCFLKIIFSGFVDNKLDLYSAVMNIIYPNTLMWYIWVLIIYYTIVMLCYRKMLKTKWNVVILVIVSIVGRVMESQWGLGVCFRNLVFCALFFYGGMQFGRVKNYLYKTKVLICGIGYIFVFAIIARFMPEIPEWIWIVLELINAITVSILLFYVVEHSKLLGFSRILSYFGKNSLIVYLLHTYVVTACKVISIRMGLESSILVISGVFMITLIVCSIAIEVIHKVSFLNFFFNPLKRKKENG